MLDEACGFYEETTSRLSHRGMILGLFFELKTRGSKQKPDVWWASPVSGLSVGASWEPKDMLEVRGQICTDRLP